jgi:hypothetical protein
MTRFRTEVSILISIRGGPQSLYKKLLPRFRAQTVSLRQNGAHLRITELWNTQSNIIFVSRPKFHGCMISTNSRIGEIAWPTGGLGHNFWVVHTDIQTGSTRSGKGRLFLGLYS